MWLKFWMHLRSELNVMKGNFIRCPGLGIRHKLLAHKMKASTPTFHSVQLELQFNKVRLIKYLVVHPSLFTMALIVKLHLFTRLTKPGNIVRRRKQAISFAQENIVSNSNVVNS